MRDISLHLMDIAQNSITANATLVEISIAVDSDQDILRVIITDNGKGMSEALLTEVEDPFCTTRTTRKVGLGIPLFKAGVERSGGSFHIESKMGVGTRVCATYGLSHIDRPPIGDIADTLHILAESNPDVHFVLNAYCNGAAYALDTREIRSVLDNVPISDPAVSKWLREELKEAMNQVFGGVI